LTVSDFTYQSYIDGVLSESIITGDLIKLAVRRHVTDLSRQRTDDFPFYFDEAHGRRFIKFSHLCRHWKGDKARQQFILEPWQQFHIMELFGWQRVAGGRRFRSVYTEVARKNGKTSLCAVKAMGHLKLDGEEGAQVYFAATKEDQARIAFRDVQNIIKVTPGLDKYFKVFTKSVTCDSSFIHPLGSDSNTQDGFDPSYGIIDEYHAHPTSGMLNVLESGMGSRRSPLIDIITTAGFNRQGPCYTEARKTSIEILRGIKHDETHLAMIFSLDEGDDWEDPSNWIKANPNLGVSVRMDFLQDRYIKAKNEGGSKEVDFKTKNLNLWTDSQETWIPDGKWMECAGERINLEDFSGRHAYLGLDLASIRDYAALAIFIPGEVNRLVMRFYIPEDSIAERLRKENINTDRWIKDGWIVATPGNVTDYDYIYDDIQRIAGILKINKLAYDRNNASQLIIKVGVSGIECEGYAQTTVAFTPAINEIEKQVFGGTMNHEGNPVLRWMVANALIMRDSNGNRKFNKGKARDKIDGAVAMGMAIGNWLASNKEEEFTGEIYML
jgi:phage terminase large subunit-like protein